VEEAGQELPRPELELEQQPEPLERKQQPAQEPHPMHLEQAPEPQNSTALKEPKHQGSQQALQLEPGQARSSCIHQEIESPK
jgi:hypothetical protein